MPLSEAPKYARTRESVARFMLLSDRKTFKQRRRHPGA